MEKQLNEFAQDITRRIEELKNKKKEQDAMRDRQMEDIMKKCFGDSPVIMEPIMPPRFPDPANSTIEEQTEWMKSEFEQLIKALAEETEGKKRLKEKVDKECEEMMEDIRRRRENLDRKMAESLEAAKARSKEMVRKFREDMMAISKPSQQLLLQLRELLDSQRKYNEEYFDRCLERERRIDAFEEALESGTYEVKVEKSKNS